MQNHANHAKIMQKFENINYL